MKEKWENIGRRLFQAIRKNPIEVFLVSFFCVAGCVYYENKDAGLDNLLHYSPVLFLITYTLNRFTATHRKGRWVYYLSGCFFLPFCMVEWDTRSSTYAVSLVVVQLFYLLASWERENRAFVHSLLTYLGAVLSSGLLSLIAWLLSVTVYFSIHTIFEIWDSAEERFLAYTAAFFFGTLAPLLFLMFNEKQKREWQGNKVFQALLNFVLSPALLIYAAILYLYFLKIVYLWSLPKGVVAWIVMSFATGGFLLQGCQLFLARRRYDWFYNRFSFVVLPALAMYWAGASYRICQYGFTEARVYLIVAGVILTTAAFFFFSRRTGRYVYVALVAVLLLSAVTYIPGITAGDIERISQSRRQIILSDRQTNPFDSVNYFNFQRIDPVDIRDYHTMQAATWYSKDDEGGIWTDFRADSFFVTSGAKRILWAEQADSLLHRQLRKWKIAEGDTIPKSLYPLLFDIEKDSVRFVVERVSFEQRMLGGKASYRINYMEGGYYLKRSNQE